MKKLTILLLISVILFNSGCHSMRKKFIRKKKVQEELPVYVDFKEYPEKPSREAYLDYYLFVDGWLDELIGALKKGVSYKREKRAIDEAIMNLEQIISFYNDQGREEAYDLYSELLGIRKDMEKNRNLSDLRRNYLVRKIEGLKRRFEKNFNYTDAERWMN